MEQKGIAQSTMPNVATRNVVHILRCLENRLQKANLQLLQKLV